MLSRFTPQGGEHAHNQTYKEADGKANVSIVSDKIATPIRVEKIITHDFKNEREKASGAER